MRMWGPHCNTQYQVFRGATTRRFQRQSTEYKGFKCFGGKVEMVDTKCSNSRTALEDPCTCRAPPQSQVVLLVVNFSPLSLHNSAPVELPTEMNGLVEKEKVLWTEAG